MKKQLMFAFLALCAVLGNASAQQVLRPGAPTIGNSVFPVIVDVKHGTSCTMEGVLGRDGNRPQVCAHGFWQNVAEEVLPTLVFEKGTKTTFVADYGGRDGVRYLTPGTVFDGERIVSFAGACWHEKHTLVTIRKNLVPASPVEVPEVMVERKPISCPTAGS